MFAPTQQEVDTLLAVFRQGNLAETEALSKAMSNRFPLYGLPWHAQGAVYLQQGRAGDALPPLRKAVILLPADPEVHNNLAIALQCSGLLAEAEASCQEALRLQPVYASAHNNLGVIFRKQGRLAESASSLQQALAIAPDFANAHFNFGLTLTDMGRFDEAESSFRQVLRIDPNHTAALLAVGNAAAAKGRFLEAEQRYRRVVAIDPLMAPAWAAITDVRKMTASDSDWISHAEHLLRTNLPPEEAAIMQFAIGKYYDDIGAFPQAFPHYHLANEQIKTLRKSAGNKNTYDRNQQTRLVDALCTYFNRDKILALQQTHSTASASQSPVFIVGMPRSGTSLVEQIIASHQDAAGAGELDFWCRAAQTLMPYAQGIPSEDAALDKLGNRYLQLLSDSAVNGKNAMRIIDKAPANFLHLGLIHAVFPKARILHITRHPADTCLSIYFQNFSASYPYTNDLDDLAHYWQQYRRMIAHWQATLPSEVLLTVPYEAIVTDQEGWSRKIIDFIGLPWDERCLYFQSTERRVGTASQWQVRQSIYNRSIGRWRHYAEHIAPLLQLEN